MKDENGRTVPKTRNCAPSIRTDSYHSPCDRSQVDSRWINTAQRSRVCSFARSIQLRDSPLSNSSTETLQHHCLFRHQRSKLKRLALGRAHGPVKIGQTM